MSLDLDKIRPALEPGETLQYAVTGQTGVNPRWRFLTFWAVVATGPRLIAITDRRIAVFKAGQARWARGVPKQLLYSLPRGTRLEHTAHGWSKVAIGTEHIWISRVAYGILDKANGDTASATPAPAAPAAPATG
jgi:hypothetical protein